MSDAARFLTVAALFGLAALAVLHVLNTWLDRQQCRADDRAYQARLAREKAEHEAILANRARMREEMCADAAAKAATPEALAHIEAYANREVSA